MFLLRLFHAVLQGSTVLIGVTSHVPMVVLMLLHAVFQGSTLLIGVPWLCLCADVIACRA